MRRIHRTTVALVLAGLACSSAVAYAQNADPLASASAVAAGYTIRPDMTYLTANNWDAKLDLYLPRHTALNPTLIYIHGGGWVGGAKGSGGKHGSFGADQTLRAFVAIRAFLTRYGLMPQPAGK